VFPLKTNKLYLYLPLVLLTDNYFRTMPVSEIVDEEQ